MEYLTLGVKQYITNQNKIPNMKIILSNREQTVIMSLTKKYLLSSRNYQE
jgi:hypothetical protein